MTPPAGREGGQGPSELVLRVASAALLVPLALAVIWLGGWPFAALAALCAMLLLREWSVIVGAGNAYMLAAFSHAGVLATLVLAMMSLVPWALALLFALAAVVFLAGLAFGRAPERWVSLGILYSGLTGIVLVLVREGHFGALLILFLFLVVWVTDIAAYFVGRRLGGPKLWRRVSPGKTWSGAVGGFLAALVAGYGVALAGGVSSPLAWVVASGLLSIFSQMGDLFESALKRRFGVKDSGRIIPGHGGVMDRIDGLVGAAILGYALALALGAPMLDPAAVLVQMKGL
ncbi:MAG: phosphatidate cytidylyltransferase [Stappia sp.]|uniref:phosphatidate cytidylyltransferase n=1 Tax=Stappia sp. TaxID=1870903 RepID=UPI000C3B1DB6|nr:CDP-archaeol synthase [Stappia sp.]MAA98074.1 phosphatidate cytidylyltransferase [Stappia sp.]MBM21776.1 phosphatidate cytidylyltransferase [Stappia sp.]